MRLGFVTVDVFTDRQFGGNPLAVVLDARGLSTEQMQAIAAEFNLAETSFVQPPVEPGNSAWVRIFTPKAEMPFAGHPNVGTAYALAREGSVCGAPISGDALLFEEKAGLVRIELSREGGETVAARLAAPQKLGLGETVDPQIVAEACGLPVSAIERARHAPQIAGCGVPFVFAELTSREALASASPHGDVFARSLPRDRMVGAHLYVRADEPGVDIQTRMFAPLHGIPEDPATGAANVALIGLLAHLQPEADLTLERVIGQGFDMGRPSLIEAAAVKAGGRVEETRIGGRCKPVMRGTLTLDE